MGPLIIVFSLLATAYGRPGQLAYNYPTPTPSVAPTVLTNVPTPTPSIAPSFINLGQNSESREIAYSYQTPTVAPTVLTNLPTPTPSIDPAYINLRQNSFQIGTPFISVGAQPETVATFPVTYSQPTINIGGQGLSYNQGANYAQGVNYEQTSNFVQPSITLLEQQQQQQVINVPAPQVTVDTSANLGVNRPQINFVPVAQTSATVNIQAEVPAARYSSAPIIQKHVYFHVAPEEPELSPSRPIAVAPPQKHYKIIFIKVPSPPQPIAPVIPVQPQNEEKTLVYILVKRPEEGPEIQVAAPVPTQPTKPEVYFIRYKTEREALTSGSTAISGVPVEDAGVGGQPIVEDVIKTNVESTTSTVVTIGNHGNKGELNGIALDLNKDSLNGGSALSVALKGSTESLQISSTPAPEYGVPD